MIIDECTHERFHRYRFSSCTPYCLYRIISSNIARRNHSSSKLLKRQIGCRKDYFAVIYCQDVRNRVQRNLLIQFFQLPAKVAELRKSIRTKHREFGRPVIEKSHFGEMVLQALQHKKSWQWCSMDHFEAVINEWLSHNSVLATLAGKLSPLAMATEAIARSLH